jgi:UDP-GlcNAc:undecaprenyl-phosphate/decaprenyl-phosphate GlcNAc-1-phosphate transferase
LDAPVTNALLALGAAAAAALATRWVAASLIPTTRILRRNHRGVLVPTGLGIAPLVGITAGVGLVAFVHAIAPDAPSPSFALAGSLGVFILGYGFGVLGLFDDVAEQPERGWRHHVPALARGRLTPGALKIVGGGTIAFVLGAAGASNVGWAIVHAAIIALMANLFNALDVRPGRAGKVYLVAAVPMTILAKGLMVPLATTLGAVAAFLPFDLRERAMLGDAGSNAIGAILGGAIVAADPSSSFRIALLAMLVALTVVAEGPSLSAWIDRIGPLRTFDRAGRVPDAPEIFRSAKTNDRNAGDVGGGLLH